MLDINEYYQSVRSTNFLLGRTALFDKSDAKEVQELIDMGYEVNVEDDWGNTPLTTAMTLEVKECLIRNGADVNYSKKSAIWNCHLKSKTTHYLFEQGAMYNKYRDAYEPELDYIENPSFPYDEYSQYYVESQDVNRRKIALVFFKNANATRISYIEACDRAGGKEKLDELIKKAHQTYLETQEIVPFEVINGRIFAYVLI